MIAVLSTSNVAPLFLSQSKASLMKASMSSRLLCAVGPVTHAVKSSTKAISPPRGLIDHNQKYCRVGHTVDHWRRQSPLQLLLCLFRTIQVSSRFGVYGDRSNKGEYTLSSQRVAITNSLQGSFPSTSKTRQPDGNALSTRLPDKSSGDSSLTCISTIKFGIITFFGLESVS